MRLKKNEVFDLVNSIQMEKSEVGLGLDLTKPKARIILISC